MLKKRRKHYRKQNVKAGSYKKEKELKQKVKFLELKSQHDEKH